MNRFRLQIVLILRCMIGGILIASAIGKLLDNRAFAQVISTYLIVPPSVDLALGLLISLGELFLGLGLLYGRRLQLTAILATLLHLGYVALSSVTLLRGLHLDNCGCFGAFFARPLTWMTAVEDCVLTALCACIILLRPRASDSGSSRTG